MSSENFDPSNHTSLDEPIYVLRDSLGTLAVSVLASKYDLSQMSYDEMVHKLLDIIEELHAAYDSMN